MRSAVVAACALLGAVNFYGQPITCIVNLVPPAARAEGLAELVGDLVLSCTGGTPTATGVPIPADDFKIFLNTNVTSRLIGPNGLSEATLMIDEPHGAPASPNAPIPDQTVVTPPPGSPIQNLCTANGQGNPCPETGTGGNPSPYASQPNVFSGLQTSPTSIDWPGIPLDPPGVSNTLVIRITNVRVNAFQLGVSSTMIPTQVSMALSVSGSQLITINNPTQTVAFVEPGLIVSNTAPATFTQCQPQNTPLISAMDTSPNNNGFNFSIAVSESFASSFKRRNISLSSNGVTPPGPLAQNVPGYPYNTETGFYAPGLFLATPAVGLADVGTRILVQFNHVGGGVHIFVPTTIPLTRSSGTPSTPPQPPSPVAAGIPTGELVLVATDASGNSASGYTAVPAASTLEGIGVAEVSYTGATGYAVYEVVNSDPSVIESASIQVAVAFLPSQALNQPALGQTTTNTNLAPASNAGTASTTAIMPRFGDVSVTSNAFSIGPCALLFLTTSAPNGDVGDFYRQSLVVSGGAPPLNWTVTGGSLPTGVTLNPNNGLLSGTPLMPGPYSFVVTVTDSNNSMVSQAFKVTINPALTLTTMSPLPAGTAGTSYSQAFAATGGMLPFTFTSPNPPTGLSLSAGGVLSGMPSAGVFNFAVTVTDGLNNSASMNFQLTVAAPGPELQVSASSLAFNAVFEGDAPPAQFVDVVPLGDQPVSFQVSIDGGAGTPAPGWLSVQTMSATAPARLVVSVQQGSLAAGTYNARVLVTDPSQNVTVLALTLKIANASPQLQVSPGYLQFEARIGAPGTSTAVLGIRNTGGGGQLGFNATVQGNSAWITDLTPGSGQTPLNSTIFGNVQINTEGLPIGGYNDVITVSSSSGAINVPVALVVSGNGAILGLNVTGIRFQARQGGGFSNAQTIQILNLGDPASSLAWTAQFVSGSKFSSASASSGTATASNPGTLTLAPTASALQMDPGPYYALLEISSPQALDSPLYVVLVLDLASSASPPLPDPSPAGLIFIGPAGQPISAGQVVNVNTSSAAAVPFQVAELTSGGGPWLAANPSTGTATGQSPGQVTVAADPTQLAAGIYTGEVDFSMSGALRSVNVTLIVLPAATVAARVRPAAAASCTNALAMTETSLVSNFSVPTGFANALIVQLKDNCGNPVSGASVQANFSNQDPSLMFREGTPGTYSANWVPLGASAQVTITILATTAQFGTTSINLIGGVSQNPNMPPVLNQNGTVNVFNDRAQTLPLAPGMIIEVYGNGLGTTTGNPPTLPLPNSYQLPEIFEGATLTFGALSAPLYYLSPTQFDVQVPVELASAQHTQVLASVNNAISAPLSVYVAPFRLAVATTADGQANAQHGVGSAYVTPALPARPNEVVVIYLSGMGSTNPSVPSGHPAPGAEPLARVTNQPTVTLDGQIATVQYAGLTPGSVGLYQINFQVPENAKTGNLTLKVSQNGVFANTTTLPVSQ